MFDSLLRVACEARFQSVLENRLIDRVHNGVAYLTMNMQKISSDFHWNRNRNRRLL